ncbi:MAG TPA: hypothetical protein VK923_16445 [Euzebyales bacterium]|nr:hypothetical protein [Euzebyales bacterium]
MRTGGAVTAGRARRSRRPVRGISGAVGTLALLLAIAATACTGTAQEVTEQASADAVTSTEDAAASPEPTAPPTDVAAADPNQDCPEPDVAAEMEMFQIDPAQFTNSTVIDATYLPMTPGTQHTYEGQAVEDGEQLDRKVISTVTDLTKVVGGVNSVVIWEQDFNDDELVESELGFFAQDDDGNVWHTGEYYELWEEGEFVGSRIWSAGDPPCALAGIQMWAEPDTGTPTYSQGFAPEPFYWADRATVDAIRNEHCVPVDCYTDVLVTAESDEVDPDAVQLKFYAPDVGDVAVGWRGDDPEMEELELVERTELDDAAMEEVRDEALAMERRGYMYGETSPAEQRSAGE